MGGGGFRPCHVRPRRLTDQWIQPSQTVKLVALWVCVRDGNEMEIASPVSRPWDSAKEACPMTSQAFCIHRHDREFPTRPAHKEGLGKSTAGVLKGSPQVQYSLLSTHSPLDKQDLAVTIYTELTTKLAAALAQDLRGDSASSAGLSTSVICQPLTGASGLAIGKGLGDVQKTQWRSFSKKSLALLLAARKVPVRGQGSHEHVCLSAESKVVESNTCLCIIRCSHHC